MDGISCEQEERIMKLKFSFKFLYSNYEKESESDNSLRTVQSRDKEEKECNRVCRRQSALSW